MDETLTGRDAAEVLSLYMRLGAAEARFDAAAVARSVRSSAGRARVVAALMLSRLVRTPWSAPRPRGGSSRRSRPTLAAAAASPGRPGRPESEA